MGTVNIVNKSLFGSLNLGTVDIISYTAPDIPSGDDDDNTGGGTSGGTSGGTDTGGGTSGGTDTGGGTSGGTDTPTEEPNPEVPDASGDVELEFIGANKGLYVDTGKTYAKYDAIECNVVVLGKDGTGTTEILGVEDTTQTNGTPQLEVIYYNPDGYFRVQKIESTTRWRPNYQVQSTDKFNVFKFNIDKPVTTSSGTGTDSYVLNGNTNARLPYAGEGGFVNNKDFEQTENSIYLFARHKYTADSDGATVNKPSSLDMGIAYYKHYTSEETYIELKPVLHNNVPCFKDTVTGNYFSIKTVFASGATLKYATKANPTTIITKQNYGE